jgi:C-terminal processing protease CtpA/Prc
MKDSKLLHLLIVVVVLHTVESFVDPSRQTRRTDGPHEMISSGFSFSDGKQILVSAQKPLGIVLEQDPGTGVIFVAEVDPSGSAGKGGVKVGDILVAVQNASTDGVDLDAVLTYIGNGPRVINLRLMRGS